MANNDLEFIYKKLKGRYDLLLTSTFALDDGCTIDVPVIRGKSALGRFDLYKEDENWDEFVFTVEYAVPKRRHWFSKKEKYTHWHPQSREQALEDIVAFMEGSTNCV